MIEKSRLSERFAEKLFWRPLRWLIFQLLLRSARKVFLTRELLFESGERGRWLRSDFRNYALRLDQDAAVLRSVAELNKLPTVGNRLMVELTIYTVAAYRSLLSFEVDRSEARQLVADTGWDVYLLMLGLMSLPFRLVSRDPGFRIRRTIRLLLRFPFNLPGAPGYEAKVWVEGEDIYTHFTNCPPQNFVRRLIAEKGDGGELEAFRQSWCRYDWPGADAIARDGKREHYSRPHTLSHGDSVCDMCWAAYASGQAPPQTSERNQL